MKGYDLDNFIGSNSLTISETMRKIDQNSSGIIFLVDEQNVLVGCVTDGDIRRFLLGGGSMDETAICAANRKPRIARSIDEARRLFHSKNYFLIPVVDDDGRIVDIYGGEGSKKTSPGRAKLGIPVVINAGGKGSRLDPYTRILPKPLIPVGDVPIIELIMQEYSSYACSVFHIIVNYKRDLMKAYFADNDRNYNIIWYDEEKPLGTGGGLRLLKGKMDSTFFFANCDALLTADYEEMLKFHRDNQNVITMICAYKNMNIPYGVVEIGNNGSIESMKEKPLMSFLANTGIYIVEPEVIDDIGDDEAIGFPDIVEREKKLGKRVAAYPVSEHDWMDMGQLPELESMRVKLYGK